MKALIAVLLLSACSFTTRPPVPPPDGPGSCETARDNLARLGGCGADLSTFVEHCKSADAAEQEIGLRMPVGCLTAATSCDLANLCK